MNEIEIYFVFFNFQMENIKFYTLCRYMTLKDSNSEVINVIHSEIKSLFHEMSIPNENIIHEWTSQLEKMSSKQKQEHIIGIELTNPLNDLKFVEEANTYNRQIDELKELETNLTLEHKNLKVECNKLYIFNELLQQEFKSKRDDLNSLISKCHETIHNDKSEILLKDIEMHVKRLFVLNENLILSSEQLEESSNSIKTVESKMSKNYESKIELHEKKYEIIERKLDEILKKTFSGESKNNGIKTNEENSIMIQMKTLIETNGFKSEAKLLENEKADSPLYVKIFDNILKSLKNSVLNLNQEIQNQKVEIASLNSVYKTMLQELNRQTENNLHKNSLIEHHKKKASNKFSLISDEEECIDLTNDDDADENVSSIRNLLN